MKRGFVLRGEVFDVEMMFLNFYVPEHLSV